MKYTLEQLIKKEVLERKNFNKNPIDKTWGYSFVDEDKFIKEDESKNSNNFYDTEKPRSTRKSPAPIPDTKTSNTKFKNKESKPKKAEQIKEVLYV